MKQVNMSEAKTNFSKIVYLLENGQEDSVIITRNNKSLLEIKLYEQKRFKLGIANGMFKIPDDFDEIDLSSDFES